jgi:hypothetical protein
MPKALIHDRAGCEGTLIRVYERPERSGSVKAMGYVCNLCRVFIPDEVPVTKLEDLRPAADAIAREIMTLSLDRGVYERAAGIIRENGALLAAAQSSNPFLNGMRRWWAVSTAVVLRRHVDGGEGTLRAIVDALAELDPDRRQQFQADRSELENMSVRFRPYLNDLIHGTQSPEVQFSESPMTYGELSSAVESVRVIAERACAAVRNVSMRLDPVVQYDWTAIFCEAWIPANVDPAYNLGDPGVPFDAEPLTRADRDQQANLTPAGHVLPDGSVSISLRNDGQKEALDVRFLLPYERTVIDLPKLPIGGTVTTATFSAQRASPINGQAVIEFCDVRGRVFREYANVFLHGGHFRDLRGPYLVRDRIVAPAAVSV